jgi:hypothetical protein
MAGQGCTVAQDVRPGGVIYRNAGFADRAVRMAGAELAALPRRAQVVASTRYPAGLGPAAPSLLASLDSFRVSLAPSAAADRYPSGRPKATDTTFAATRLAHEFA